MKLFSFAILAASLTLAASAAYWRATHGQPALLDFAAIHGEGPLPFIRPPFYKPLAALPLESAAAVWLALNVVAGLAFGFWSVQRTGEPALALLLAVFLPALVALSVGQDTLLLLALLAVVFSLLECRRPMAAGLLVSLLWVKFQFLPAFLLLLVVRREWRALGAFGLGTLALLASSVPELPSYIAYLRDMAGAPGVVPCRRCMPNLHALIPWPGAALAASGALLVVSAGRMRGFHPTAPKAGASGAPGLLPPAFALAATSALVASHHAHVYDCVLLFLAVVLVHGNRLVQSPRSKVQSQNYSYSTLGFGPWTLDLVFGLIISPLPYLLPYLWAPAQVVPALAAVAGWGAIFRLQASRSGAAQASR